jgi:hypothetical protein
VKNSIYILLLIIISISLYGQEKEAKYNRYFSKDQLSFTLNATQWIQSEKQVTLSPFSRGCNIEMMYPVLGKKSNVALAIGFGAAFHNYFLDNFISPSSDSVFFIPIPDSLSMHRYKLNTNYVTLPIELRFRTNPSGVSRLSTKFHAGFRVSYLINSKTKYVGKDSETEQKVKEKTFYIDHIPQFDYGVSLKVGRGRFLAHGYYSLSTLFHTTATTKIVPFEVGFTIVLF